MNRWVYMGCCALLLVAGCGEGPDLSGRWAGVTTMSDTAGLRYTFDLRLRETGVEGEGGVAIYDSLGAATDSTLGIVVGGTYDYPEVRLVFDDPYPDLGARGRAAFTGRMAASGDEIVGTLVSDATGRLELILEQQGTPE